MDITKWIEPCFRKEPLGPLRTSLVGEYAGGNKPHADLYTISIVLELIGELYARVVIIDEVYSWKTVTTHNITT
jgi:hypothetical protein